MLALDLVEAAPAALIAWLDPSAHPLLVQLPAETYAALTPSWGLPPVGL